MTKKLLLFACLLGASLASYRVSAQGVTSGSISGVVTDAKGEPLPGASVLATHTPSGTQYGNATRVDGRYNFPAARVGGPYTVRITFVGYKEQTRENVYVQLGQNFVADFKLEDESSQLQEVTVTSVKDQVLNENRTGASTNISGTQIQRLPSIGRDIRDFSSLTPQAGSNTFTFGGRSPQGNNFTVDGATLNNTFGLSPLPGGQSGATPFSIDAIQDLNISLAPYDVRQGGFTGAGVSAVTRSGTNEFQGSVYYFWRDQSFVGKKVDKVENTLQNFTFNNYGIRLGGPLIKNKLFFFFNVEIEKRSDPAYSFPVRPNASTPGTQYTQATDDNDPQTGLKPLRQFLIDNYSKNGFDPGGYSGLDLPSNNQKGVVRFDYNINQNNKFTIRANALEAYQDVTPSGRGNNNNTIAFTNSYYRINNKQYSITAELNSTFGNGKFSNNLVAGWNSFRDIRQNAGGASIPNFPSVDILGPNGQNMVFFGPDPFTPNNRLNQDNYQFNDNFNIYLKNHTVTLGTANDYFRFDNTFTAQINGVYQYNSIADFIADATPATTGAARPNTYIVPYSAVKGTPAPTAKWEAMQLGFFAQDEFTGFKKLKLTAGLRVDIPIFLTDLIKNNYANKLNFNGEQVRVGYWPDQVAYYSPRVGVNWDVFGDRTTQVRGGTGIFTGRVPFVWLSNGVSTNGLNFGTANFPIGTVPLTNTADGFPYDFSPVPFTLPENSTSFSDLENGNVALITNPLDRNFGRSANQFELNPVSKNFRFTQVWRSSLAIDQQLPGGVVGTAEFLYTKDLNAAYYRNLNIAPAVGTLAGDGRPLYGSVGGTRAIISNDRRVNADAGNVFLLENTNKGYAYSITTQLQKNFSQNFSLSLAYTYTDARELFSQSSSTASSAFLQNITVAGANSPELSYNNNLTPHRVVAFGTYKFEYLNHLATTFGLTYTGNSGSNFSYAYQNSPNNDGQNGAGLIYIPRNRDEIALTYQNANDTRTLDQIWQQLDAYISQDRYLSTRRGQYAERNGAFAPWVNRLNFSLLQDFFVNLGGKRQTFQFSLNITNVLNMFNSSWGLVKNVQRSQILTFAGYEQPNSAGNIGSTATTPTVGRPVYSFNLDAANNPLTTSYLNSQTVGGRWQMQLGLRYIFN
jgi:hypothetical protein